VCVCKGSEHGGEAAAHILERKGTPAPPGGRQSERRRVARINFLISFFAGDEDNPSINELITYSFLSLAIV
jgi:hypothetical protein